MESVAGFDHVAITVGDLEVTCAFYDRLFGAQTRAEHAPGGKVLVRQIALGGALLSVHQVGNKAPLAARRPTVGAADICLRWRGTIQDATKLLHDQGIDVIEGPVARQTADGLPGQSVYFRDPDDNLLEIMAAD